MKSCTQKGGYSKRIHMRTSGGEKSVIWSQANVVEYFLCIGPAKYTKASLPARKTWLFSIILYYVIIRIYIILHIYLQVSKTEEPPNCIE